MKTSSLRLRIAVQKKGRLLEPSLSFLSSCGYTFPEVSGQELLVQSSVAPVDLLLVRDDDIPEFVTRGVADFGIIGENVLQEEAMNARVIKKIGFGKCRLSIAVPKDSTIQKIEDLEGERIATSYPRLLTQYLQKHGISAAVIPINGSVEVAPQLNLADAICDLVQSGSTLKANGLVELYTVLESEAVLITSPGNGAEKDIFIKAITQ